jgi:TolB-like protein
MQPHQFFFGGYALDLTRGRLVRDDCEIDLRPKSFDVLRFLVEHAGQLVSKEEIVKSVWRTVVVTDESLARCICDIRAAIGDDEQRLIRTIPRRGYIFDAPVSLGQATPPAATAETAPPLSVVVLPFANLGGTDNDHFADALTNSLTADLAHLSGAFVIAPQTAFTYKGKPINAWQIGRELGVRYLLGGSLFTGGDRVRVIAHLIDGRTGAQLWADRFDKRRADLLDMQDEITAWLARLVGIKLVAAEGDRAQRERPDALDAIDLTMRGMAIANLPSSLVNERRAQALFEAALRIDPANVNALNGLATTHAHQILSLASNQPAEQLRVAQEAAAKASGIAPLSADTHYGQALVQFAAGEPGRALSECETAIGFNRNHASAHAWRGWMKVFLGRAQETEAHVAKAMRLVPRDPQVPNWHNFLGAANFFLGRIDDAIEHGRKAVEINPTYHIAYFYLAAALALAGKSAAAAEARAVCLRHNPEFNLSRFRKQPRGAHPAYLAQRARLVEGLRLSGLPD